VDVTPSYDTREETPTPDSCQQKATEPEPICTRFAGEPDNGQEMATDGQVGQEGAETVATTATVSGRQRQMKENMKLNLAKVVVEIFCNIFEDNIVDCYVNYFK
jgi:hypothetical protein